HSVHPAVEGDRVAWVVELLVVRNRGRLPILLERRSGDRRRNGVVLAAGDEKQRASRRVLRVDLGGRVRNQIGRGVLEQRLPGGRDRPAVVKVVRLLLGEGIAEAVAELLPGQRDAALPIGRILQRDGGHPQARRGQVGDRL